jgi:hypothetical protein
MDFSAGGTVAGGITLIRDFLRLSHRKSSKLLRESPLNWSTRPQDVAVPPPRQTVLSCRPIRTDPRPTHPSPRFLFCSSSRHGVYSDRASTGAGKPPPVARSPSRSSGKAYRMSEKSAQVEQSGYGKSAWKVAGAARTSRAAKSRCGAVMLSYTTTTALPVRRKPEERVVHVCPLVEHREPQPEPPRSRLGEVDDVAGLLEVQTLRENVRRHEYVEAVLVAPRRCRPPSKVRATSSFMISLTAA